MKRTKKILCLFLSLCMMIPCMAGLSFTSSAADDPAIIVSLGDSFSSGEGIEPFFGQDKELEDKVADMNWLAHRSQKAWSGQLRAGGETMTLDTNWFFVAASGAETKDLAGQQSISFDKGTGNLKGTVELAPQLDVFNGLDLTANDYVTISIGGNDVGFVDIMTCAVLQALREYEPDIAAGLVAIMGGHYVTLAEKTVSQLIEDKKAIFFDDGGIRSKIKAVYKSIAEKANDATIIVAGYPKLLSADGFTMDLLGLEFPVSGELCNTINTDGVKWLNAQLAEIVDECAGEGMNICFVDVQEAFEGHEAYTDSAYINPLIVLAQGQEISNSNAISSYSIHPNEKGAEVYAAAVQAKIDDIENPAIYTVTYDGNGAKSGEVPIDANRYRRGETVTVFGNTGNLENGDCRFLGWAESPDAAAAEYTEGSRFSIDAADKTLYAVWKTPDPAYPIGIPAYIPSTNTGSSSSAAPAETTPDITKFTVRGEENREIHSSSLSWDTVPDASGYTLYVGVDGKYVFLHDLGTSKKADVVLGTNGKYYVSTGNDYTAYKYNEKTGKFDRTGTLRASEIDSIVKANNVTLSFMVKFRDKNGRESTAENSYKVSVRIYYKPAVTLTTGLNSTNGRSFIRLGWDKVEGAEAYKVFRYVDGKLKTVTELDADHLSLRISGTKSGRKYTYAVKALVGGSWTKVYQSDLASIVSK